MTCRFEHSGTKTTTKKKHPFPGECLIERKDVDYERYVDHHVQWMEGLLEQNVTLTVGDMAWLEWTRNRDRDNDCGKDEGMNRDKELEPRVVQEGKD